MVFQKPTPFPMTITTTSRSASASMSLPKANWTSGSNGLRRAALWDEVKGKLAGLQPFRRPAAALCIAGDCDRAEVLLLDEPASASTRSRPSASGADRRAEADYCIAIVTHNMRQAARSSDYTTFLYLGELSDSTRPSIFTHPGAHGRLHHRPLRLTRDRGFRHACRAHHQTTTPSLSGSTDHRRDGRMTEPACRRDRSGAARQRTGGARSGRRKGRPLERPHNVGDPAVGAAPAMARDLRSCRLKIGADIERICDYAANVAKRSIALAQSPPPPVHALPRMAHLALLWSRTSSTPMSRDADKALVV
jgi:hypothetical protein